MCHGSLAVPDPKSVATHVVLALRAPRARVEARAAVGVVGLEVGAVRGHAAVDAAVADASVGNAERLSAGAGRRARALRARLEVRQARRRAGAAVVLVGLQIEAARAAVGDRARQLALRAARSARALAARARLPAGARVAARPAVLRMGVGQPRRSPCRRRGCRACPRCSSSRTRLASTPGMRRRRCRTRRSGPDRLLVSTQLEPHSVAGGWHPTPESPAVVPAVAQPCATASVPDPSAARTATAERSLMLAAYLIRGRSTAGLDPRPRA